MSDDQFTQLFKAMQAGFHDVHAEIAEVKEQVLAVYDLLDKNIAEHERQEQERAAMAHQLNRHDQHIEQLAGHAGVELRFD